MVRMDLIWLGLAHLLFLALVLPYKKLMPKKAIMYIMMVVPLVLLGSVVVFWVHHMLAVSSHVDSHLAYDGIEVTGSPYVSPWQNQTPTYFAFARFILSFGDGSYESYDRIVLVANYFSLVLYAGCVLLVVRTYWKIHEGISEPTLVALATVLLASMLPAFKNVHLANLSIWVGTLVAFYLYITRTFKSNRADFIGGIVLGIAFMIKPYLLLVLIYLFFLGIRGRRPYVLLGLVVAGILGFLASLQVSGISLGAYRQYLFDIRETTYSILVNWYYPINLSLMKYFPTSVDKILGAGAIIVFSVVAFVLTKKNNGGELPWFFLALLPFPILWEEHLIGIFPAFFFFILSREREWEQILIAAMASCLMICSSLTKVPLVVNALLLGLWFWGAFLPTAEAPSAETQVATSGLAQTVQ